jgi:hypothetical protein
MVEIATSLEVRNVYSSIRGQALRPPNFVILFSSLITIFSFTASQLQQAFHQYKNKQTSEHHQD